MSGCRLEWVWKCECYRGNKVGLIMVIITECDNEIAEIRDAKDEGGAYGRNKNKMKNIWK